VVDALALDEQIDCLADWIDIGAEALLQFHVSGQGLFRRTMGPEAGRVAVHPTSTLRSFFALAEYVRFLYEERRQEERPLAFRRRPRRELGSAPRQAAGGSPYQRVCEVLRDVIEHYLGQLPTNHTYVRRSRPNRINVFTDGHLLMAVALLPRLQEVLALDPQRVGDIHGAAEAVATQNEAQLRRWRGGQLTDLDAHPHDFLTLSAVRGIDAYRDPGHGIDRQLSEQLQDRIRGDVLRLLAFHAAGVSSRFDASELTFGLALLGRFPTSDGAQLAERAIEAIVTSQAADGAWPPARFVSLATYTGGRGVLHVTSYEIALTLTQMLMRYLRDGEERCCEALLPALERAFRLVQSYYTAEGGYGGWANDHARQPVGPESWSTAIVLVFLILYRDALIDLRQRRILQRYDTQYPANPFCFEPWPDLTGAFRGAAPIDPTLLRRISDPTDDGSFLPKLEAQTLGRVATSWAHCPRGCSIILYGPPGTGKSGTVRAIAQALQWPLLTFSPPQFLCRSGLEGFEASAVEIFDDLQRLRRVVVLFDECEDFFRRRQPDAQMATRTIRHRVSRGYQEVTPDDKSRYLRRRRLRTAMAVALLLAVAWQIWHSQALIGELRAELASANAERAELTTRLQTQEQVRREPEPGMQASSAPFWSAEGLTNQPRLAEYATRAQGMGFAPGSTRWRPSAVAIPAQFTQPLSTWPSPGALAAGLVSDLNLGEPLGQDAWEATVRVLMPEAGQASAIIMVWGLKDDSVAGRDYLFVLRQHQGKWYVAEVQERFHCYRGVTADDICL
jgi:hypothetical protein